jgi:hypothetical protein
MSIPQFLVVAVISGRFNYKTQIGYSSGELASAVTTILAAKDEGVAPYIFPVAGQRCRFEFVQFAISKGFPVWEKPLFPHLLNAQQIHLWLALDKEGANLAKESVARTGPAPEGFYREIFSDTVVRCDFTVPDPPIEPNFQDWFDFLVKKFEPWKQRIWHAFYESS